MAKPEMIVMVRWAGGLVGRNTTEEERKASGPETAQIGRRWKEAGVRLLGVYGFPGQGLDGLYSHVAIYAVPSMDVLAAMNQDLWTSQWAKHEEIYSMVIGVTDPGFADGWNKL